MAEKLVKNARADDLVSRDTDGGKSGNSFINVACSVSHPSKANSESMCCHSVW